MSFCITAWHENITSAHDTTVFWLFNHALSLFSRFRVFSVEVGSPARPLHFNERVMQIKYPAVPRQLLHTYDDAITPLHEFRYC
jgi:hypothetical protein